MSEADAMRAGRFKIRSRIASGFGRARTGRWLWTGGRGVSGRARAGGVRGTVPRDGSFDYVA
jgi:hypothetical protein